MRILLFAPHFPEYALRLADALGARHEVLLVVDAEALEAEFAGRDRAALSARCRVEPCLFRFPADLVALVRRIRAFAPDVVHLQEASGPKRALFGLVALLAAPRRAKRVLTVHDPLPHSGADAALEPELRLLRRLTRAGAGRLIVHGPFCRRELARSTGLALDRISVLRHGILLAAPDVAPPGPAEPRRFLVFGRMKAYKGLDVIAEAAGRLEAAGRRFRLRLVGTGEELDRLRPVFAACRSVEIDDRFVPGADLAAEIAACDVVLLPYRDATQSGVLAAAYGNRRPVIASRVGDLPDVVTDGVDGLLVDPGDVDGLAAAMARTIDEPDLVAALARGAAAVAEGPLAWETIAAGSEAVYAAA